MNLLKKLTWAFRAPDEDDVVVPDSNSSTEDWGNFITHNFTKIFMAGLFSIMAVLGLVVVMLLVNVYIHPFVNSAVMLIGFFMILMAGVKVTNLLAFGVFGLIAHFLQDKDKSKGVFQGLLLWMRIVIAFMLLAVVAGFTLMTFPFEHSIGSFGIMFWAVLLGLLALQHYNVDGSVAWKFILGYAILASIFAAWIAIFPQYPGKNFANGEAIRMVHPVTREVVGDYTPEMCRSEYIEGVLIEYPAKGFDYATKGTCFHPKDGVRLVPITTEDVQGQNAKTWGSTVNGAISKHPAISWVEERIHMPWWVAGLIVVGTIVVWRIIPRKEKSGSDSKEESKDYGINLAAVIVALGFSSLLAAVAVIALNVAGVMNGLSFSTAVAMANNCATPASIEHYKFDERGRTLTICQGGEELQLYPKVAGKPLIISLVTNTDDEKYYLAGKYPEEFVNFLYPWQVPGSTQNIHRLTPKPRQKADEEGPIEAVALAMGQPGVRFLIRQQR